MAEAGVSYNPILQAKECKREHKLHFCLIRAKIQTAPPGKYHSSCLSGRSCSPVAKRAEHLIIRVSVHSPLCAGPSSLSWADIPKYHHQRREQIGGGITSSWLATDPSAPGFWGFFWQKLFKLIHHKFIQSFSFQDFFFFLISFSEKGSEHLSETLYKLSATRYS